MKNSQLKKIEVLVLEKIAVTKEKIIKYTELCKPIPPQNSIGRISRMDAINNKSVTEAALRQAKKEMYALDTIKKKINEKDFGQCIKCRKQIPFERILLVPESIYCVNCAK